MSVEDDARGRLRQKIAVALRSPGRISLNTCGADSFKLDSSVCVSGTSQFEIACNLLARAFSGHRVVGVVCCDSRMAISL